ncbi:uncharacterized protein JCM10292_004895 [Rhodotorula paludigena]|uniref:uncharacterized protein n=1 Tax=Rhodotorula paludigena TaxID=86838 RepID=UPI00316B4196
MATVPSTSAIKDKKPVVPTRFQAAVFPSAGQPLDIVEVEYRAPAKGCVTVKVDACFLSKNDRITGSDLRGHGNFPACPSAFCIGEVVEVGSGAREGGGSVLLGLMSKLNIAAVGSGGDKQGSRDVSDSLFHKFKPGEKVIVAHTHQCLVEYCTAWGQSTISVSPNSPVYEQAVVATFGARVLGVWERYAHEHENESSDIREALKIKENKRFAGGAGCVAVYGSGGFASLAYHLLLGAVPKDRIVLVSPSTKHRAEDYRMAKDDFLQVGHVNLDDALCKLGGVKCLVAVDQPDIGFVEVLNAMREGGEINCLTIKDDGFVKLPIGAFLSRSLSLRGPPTITAMLMHRAQRLCEQRNLEHRISFAKYRFDDDGVRKAYDAALRDDDAFDVVAVVMEDKTTKISGSA